MNSNSKFNALTTAQFEAPSNDILKALACDKVKRDGFLKRIFKKDIKQRDFETAIEAKKKLNKRGVFGFLKKKKAPNQLQ